MLIRANADTPEQAAAAQDAGVLGIGLCRTEAMLLGTKLSKCMGWVSSWIGPFAAFEVGGRTWRSAFAEITVATKMHLGSFGRWAWISCPALFSASRN